MNGCKTYACPTRGCGHVVHLHHDVEQRLRRTHESFYCPAGHALSFKGATNDEKRIRFLEQTIERWRDRWEEQAEAADEWKLQARTCPFGCGYRVLRKRLPEAITAALVLHLVEEHGARMPELDAAVVRS